MTTALARRLEKLEADRRDKYHARWQSGIDTLLLSMDREHVAFFQDWMREHCGGLTLRRLPGDTWYDLLDRDKPPALVRAVWLLMCEYMDTGAPVSLAPSVAEVYLSDPDAFPANACEGCGYLLPTQSKVRPDGTYRHVGRYLGACPVCGRDNHPDEEMTG